MNLQLLHMNCALLLLASGHSLSYCLLLLICLLDIDKYLVTSRSPWGLQCGVLVLSLFFHTHFLILSIISPNTVALWSLLEAKDRVSKLTHGSAILSVLWSLLGRHHFCLFCLCCQVGFFPNTLPDNSCCFKGILENMHCVQIPDCKQILPEFYIMTGSFPKHWLAGMPEAPRHIFMTEVHYGWSE